MTRGKKIVAVVLGVMILLSASFSAAVSFSKNDSDTTQFKSDIVSIYKKYDTALTSDEKQKPFGLRRLIVSNYDGETFGAVDKAVDKKHNLSVFQYDSAQAAENAYQQLKKISAAVDMDSVAVFDNYDKYEMSQSASEIVGFKTFNSKYRMGYDDVEVAVIDTAVMLDHPQLKGRFLNDGYDFSEDGFDNADYKGSLEGNYYYHSTFISGIIANNTPDNVKIIPYKVVPNGGVDGTVSAIVSAINDAVDNGAEVISVSISSSSGITAFRNALKNAVQNGVCLCASAGNKAEEIKYSYPAATEGAITVTALNSAGNALASYSNYGSVVDFAAPGSKIYSAVPTENGYGYAEKSGTSYSTPYVAAVCANIKSMNNTLSKENVCNIIQDFAVDFGDEGFDDYYGYGVPNISDMVYSENGVYNYKIPQGELNVYSSIDYTENTQPWRLLADRMVSVNIDSAVSSIGSYAFYNMQNAEFQFNSTIESVGDFAFYGAKKLKNIEFGANLKYIGDNAFYDNDSNFTVSGYRNTPAEYYCNNENIKFIVLGCNHNYVSDIIEPEEGNPGYTVYTCSVCNDTYTGEYIESNIILTGQCGENLTFKFYNTGTLNISGTGDMFDYENVKAPWADVADQIKVVSFSKNIGSISPLAFYGCSHITAFRSGSENHSVVNGCLYNSDGTELILAVCSSNGYEMPASLEKLDARAFAAGGLTRMITNEKFTLSSSVIYDLQGNIVMALPSCKTSVLTVTDDIDIQDYAFILTSYPDDVRVYSTSSHFGKYSIGYQLSDDGFVKTNLKYYGYIDAPAYKYAVDNGFETNLLNSGSCGENLTWYYSVDDDTLTISGSGDMTRYTSYLDVPWYNYIDKIKTLVIGNKVKYLSNYAFFKAYNLTSVTLPLSVSAPKGQTVWYGCNNIKSLCLTYGTGRMEDYGASNTSKIYTYTPWYMSRSSIENFFIDSNVKYIGNYAFRDFDALEKLILSGCESIGKYAFYDCDNLTYFKNYSKSTQYGTRALFEYSAENTKNKTIYAYCDSSSKDYSETVSCDFVSIGCDHSRGYASVSDKPSCCYDGMVSYYCKDCGEFVYQEYTVAETQGHCVKGALKNTDKRILPGMEVYLNGELCAISNSYGRFVAENIKCGEYLLEIKSHGFVMAKTNVAVDKSNVFGNLEFRYGNYINDGAVNLKDYQFALQHDFDDLSLMDFGKIDNSALAVDAAYKNQMIPCVTTISNEPSADANDPRYLFSVDVNFGSDYTVTSCGYLYGKNMDEDFMILENADKLNAQGYALRNKEFPVNNSTKQLTYGSSSGGTIRAVFYIKYTNGVHEHIYYSDISSHVYG